jgi:hypothetical protein
MERIPFLPTSWWWSERQRLFFRFQNQSFSWRLELPIAKPTFHVQNPLEYSNHGSKKTLQS